MNRKNILCITNSYPVHPRLRKIASLFKEHNIQFFAWNRDDRNLDLTDSRVHVYSSNNGYGTAFKMVIGVPGFIQEVLKYLKNNDIDIIIIRHWSTCFILMPFLLKKYKIIYDVSDMPDSENSKMVLIYKLLEKYVIKKSDIIILSSNYYMKFYEKYRSKTYILENKVDPQICETLIIPIRDKKLTIAFIGMIRYYDMLINLVKSSKNLPVEIHFYGKGIDSDRLIDYCKENNYKNVYIHGAYDYKEIPNLYCSADLIYTVYPAENENVQYSIPNKFYESLAFEKPLIASKSTALGELVEKNNLGFTVDGHSVEDLKNIFTYVMENPSVIQSLKKQMQLYKKNNDIYWNGYEVLAQQILADLK